MPNDPNQTKMEALQYMMTLSELCQERGGYTLDEAVQLDCAIKHLKHFKTNEPTLSKPQNSKNDTITMPNEKNDIVSYAKLLFSLLRKSQKLGQLSLEEAWTVFNAHKIISS